MAQVVVRVEEYAEFPFLERFEDLIFVAFATFSFESIK
jgi:hypothetical protein